MEGWVDFGGWLNTKMSCLPADSHLSTLPLDSNPSGSQTRDLMIAGPALYRYTAKPRRVLKELKRYSSYSLFRYGFPWYRPWSASVIVCLLIVFAKPNYACVCSPVLHITVVLVYIQMIVAVHVAPLIMKFCCASSLIRVVVKSIEPKRGVITAWYVVVVASLGFPSLAVAVVSTVVDRYSSTR